MKDFFYKILILLGLVSKNRDTQAPEQQNPTTLTAQTNWIDVEKNRPPFYVPIHGWNKNTGEFTLNVQRVLKVGPKVHIRKLITGEPIDITHWIYPKK